MLTKRLTRVPYPTVSRRASWVEGETTGTGSKGASMPNSVYKIIELVGTSPDSWEAAAKQAVDTASGSLEDLRVAEVVEQDMKIEDGKVTAYRTRVRLSFKYHV